MKEKGKRKTEGQNANRQEWKRRERLRRKRLRNQRRRWRAIRERSYAERDRLLKRLGYSSYAAYLRSSLWAEIRQRVLDAERGICRICRRPALQVHHQRYTADAPARALH